MIKRPTMIGLTNAVAARFLPDHEPPCLPVYQPTHRRRSDNQQDPIRFRSLLKGLEASLLQKYPAAHQVNQNPRLDADGIRVNPESLPANELRAPALQAVEPRYQARLESLREEFKKAHSENAGSDDLTQIAQASTSGRVETLLIDGDCQIAGRLDGATGRVELVDPTDPHAGDLLVDLVELVAQNGGTVLVIPTGQMPSSTGLAAIYRY